MDRPQVKLTRAQLDRLYGLGARHPYAVTIRDEGEGCISLQMIGPEGEITDSICCLHTATRPWNDMAPSFSRGQSTFE